MNNKFIIIDVFCFFLDFKDVIQILSKLSLDVRFSTFSFDTEYCV